MGLLLYKSNEMFSATELIRKSKMIFDKVVNDEIDKAIILRDGKPGFLLMDFVKYEKIMTEYEELKRIVQNNTLNSAPNEKVKPKKIKKNKTTDLDVSKTNIPKEDIEKVQDIKKKQIEKEIKLNIETTQPLKDEDLNEQQKNSAFVTPPRPKPEVKIDEEPIEKIKSTNNNIVENVEINQNSITDDEELKIALDRLKSMNLDDDMKIIAEQRVKERLQIVREERAKLLAEQEEDEKEELKEELELQVYIKEENKKKERELKEFWD